ncbi:MAG: N-acetylmuramoyl-L-alanine amidase, partial [Acidobacteria bacterium]|nr:N-acetylmuramoyl-L-alanine amidase [Acidobacteriota bacterium]
NNRSIGIEIANIGAYTTDKAGVLNRWYDADATTGARLVLNDTQQASIRSPSKHLFSANEDPIIGNVQGTMLIQYDFTPQQYESLSRLVAALCDELPLINCDYPRDENGELIDHKLPDAMLEAYQGLIGHFHIQTNKVDPGPAFQWDLVVDRARSYMNSGR